MQNIAKPNLIIMSLNVKKDKNERLQFVNNFEIFIFNLFSARKSVTLQTCFLFLKYVGKHYNKI